MSSSIPKTYTITAALPYANGPIHIGHMAGVYLPADIYARYQRMRGQEVAFICGSDEGGAAITLQAREEAITPQALADKYHTINAATLNSFGISFDIFFRTSDPLHHRTAQAFFATLHQKGAFIFQQEKQYYDPEANLFLADRYIEGTCPQCKKEGAYGDQCEACGTTLSPQELHNPISKLSGAKPIRKQTGHWYLPLDQHQSWLADWILDSPEQWRPNVYGQCKSWLQEGLRPRAITRDLPWGVPVPQAQGKVLYVWFEAPIGYISATQAWAAKHGKAWKKYWQDPSTQLIHFIGKDNIAFHCILFPAMLKAHGDYILPTFVPANEFMNLEGKKISTSRNHAIWLHEYLHNFPDQQDVLRYVLCALAPESKDSNFTWEAFRAHNNQALVATVGNLFYRTITLVHNYCEGKVPPLFSLEHVDKTTLAALRSIAVEIGIALEACMFRKACTLWLDIAHLGNKYLAETAPWHAVKQDLRRADTILHVTLQILANIALLGAPFLPTTAAKMQKNLCMPRYSWQDGGRHDLLSAGTSLGAPVLFFRKMDTIPQLQHLENVSNLIHPTHQS